MTGIDGLTREIRYLDAGTQFVVQDDDADDTFLNEEVLPLLSDYGIDVTEVRYVVSSGLTSKYETNAQSSAADTEQ